MKRSAYLTGTNLWHAVRIAVAAILLFAAWQKALQLATEPGSQSASFLDLPIVNFFAVLFESGFAVWLLGGLFPKFTRGVTLVLFTFFATVSLSKGLHGLESCGCFGAKRVNPYITFSLDAVIVLLASFCSFKSRSDTSVSAAKPGRARLIAALAASCAVSVAFGATVLYMLELRAPVALLEQEQKIKRGTSVVLDANLWIGKPFPLALFCAEGKRLSTGRWLVMIHRTDCPECRRAFPIILKAAKEENLPLALINIEPETEVKVERGVALIDRLSPGYRWFAETPVVFTLDEGIVGEIRKY
ncbi:MAG: hypothetical protein IKS14_02240 [Thermoguttaceae bacterium]|nr:hypothetical protein [Thermoguttaceae bacterium]